MYSVTQQLWDNGSATIEGIDKNFGFLSCKHQSEFLEASFMVLAKLCKKTCVPKWKVGDVPDFHDVHRWVSFWNQQNEYYDDTNFPNGTLSITKEEYFDSQMAPRPRMEITYTDWLNRTVKVDFTARTCQISWEGSDSVGMVHIMEQFEELLHLVTAWDAWDN